VSPRGEVTLEGFVKPTSSFSIADVHNVGDPQEQSNSVEGETL
jgi:hypothetical protein